MPDPLAKLHALAVASIASLPGAPGSATWAKAFERTLATAHTAAFYAGLAEKSAGGKARAWLAKFVGRAALSKDQRAALKRAVSEQVSYLRKFVTAAPDMSEAAVKARAAMYAGSVRGTYYAARHPGLPQYPGDGQTKCLTNCLCSLDERDDGLYWVLDGGEHCADCEAMAAGSPYGGE